MLKLNLFQFNHFNQIDYKNKYIINNYKKINEILGTSLDKKIIDNILINLGFQIDKEIKIPSWRHDIETINDLAEEVARVIGYNNIPKNNLKVLNNLNTKNMASNENLIRNYLIKNGFNEVINDPFVGKNLHESIQVDNPLDSNRKYLRLNIINSLLKNLDYNEKRQKESIKFFEISNVYNKTDNKINSKKYLSIIISGRKGLNYKEFNKKLDDKYLTSIIADLGLNNSYVKEIDRNSFNSKIKSRIFYIECCIDDIKINNNSIEEKKFNFKKATSVSEFPSSLRDISISINNENIIEDLISSVFQIKLRKYKEMYSYLITIKI